MPRRILRPSLLIAIAGSLVVAGPAFAEFVCHPDPAGTRTASIAGRVASYSMDGSRVTLAYGRLGHCWSARWNVATSAPPTAAPGACSLAAPSAPRTAVDRSRQIALVQGAADQPDRVQVTRAGRLVRDWPLPERARSIDVEGDIAVYSTDPPRGVYAVRLADGRASLIAPNRPGDTPQIEAAGVVFQDNLFKRDARKPRTLMKFYPRSFVEQALAQTGRPLDVGGQIASFAMDGQRVAIAVRGRGDACDRVMFWNVLWRFVSRLTEEDETTCHETRAGGTLTAVSVGGLKAQWVIRRDGRERILSASTIDCVERLVASGGRHLSLAGDGDTLAYALRGAAGAGSVLGSVDPDMRGRTLETTLDRVVQLATDRHRIAVLRASGRVELLRGDGSVLASYQPRAPRALALRAGRVVVLTRSNTLEVYGPESAAPLHSWRVPAAVDAAVDAHFGVAIVTRGRSVYGLNLENGRVARLAQAPARVHAQIEESGLVYGYNAGANGRLHFVSTAAIEAALN